MNTIHFRIAQETALKQKPGTKRRVAVDGEPTNLIAAKMHDGVAWVIGDNAIDLPGKTEYSIGGMPAIIVCSISIPDIPDIIV